MKKIIFTLFFLISTSFAIEVNRLAIIPFNGNGDNYTMEMLFQNVKKYAIQSGDYNIVSENIIVEALEKAKISPYKTSELQRWNNWQLFREYWEYTILGSMTWSDSNNFAINIQLLRMEDGKLLQSLAIPGQSSNIENVAIMIIRRLLPNRRELFAEIYELYQDSFKKKNWERSLALCNWNLKIDSQYFLAYYNRARVYEETLYYSQAAEDYQQAKKLTNNSNNIAACDAALVRLQPKLQEMTVDRQKLLVLADEILKPLQNIHQAKIQLFSEIVQEIHQRKPNSNLKELRNIAEQLKTELPDLLQKLYTAHTSNITNQSLVALVQRAEQYDKNRKKIESELATQHNDMANFYLQYFQKMQKEGRWDLAIKSLDKALVFEPNSSQIFHLKAMVMVETRENSKALEFWNIALQQNTNFQEVYLRRGELYIALENWDKASEDFETLLKINPKSSDSYCYLGRIAVEKNNDNQALVYFDQAIKLNSQHADAFFHRAKLYERRLQYLQAISDYKNASEFSPNMRDRVLPMILKISDYILQDSQIYVEKAIQSYEFGDASEALEYLNIALTLNTKNHEAYYRRGICYYMLGKYSQALESFNTAFSLTLPKEKWLLQRAMCYYKIGNLESALQDLQQAIQVEQGFHPAHYLRGKILEQQKDYQQAIKSYEAAVRLSPAFAPYCLDTARVYSILGQYKQAQYYINRGRQQIK